MANVDSSDTPTPMSSNPNSAASVQEAPEIRTRRKTDPAWGYCTQFTEDGRKKIKCMYCGSIFSGGGIHRFKEHLAKYPGNVTACSKVDPEVEHTMYQHIEDGNAKKRKAQKDFEKEHPYGPEPGEKEEESAVEVSNTSVVAAAPTRRAAAVNRGRKRGTTTPNIGKYFKPRTNPGDQPTIKSVLQGEAVKLKTDLCVAKWFIDASIPFNASNSIFYQPMIDAVCAYGSGYKGPNFNQLRGSLLAKCVEETKNYVDGYRKTWRETGCTVMADGWTDRKRTLINFLVYCPKDEWWQTYGCSAPHLQKLALRVLSQTCSASGCERNWSLFEHVHSKKRNRFEHQRLNDIVYVHNNLRLHQRSKRYTRNYDPISLEEIGKGNKEWIVEDNPPRLNSEELNAFRTELAELSIHCSDELVLNLDDVEANVIRSSD